jgi:hypothetical protein
MSPERLSQSLDSMIHMPNEKREILIPLKQEPHMMVNGLEASVMDMVFKNGQMALNMKDNGRITELMERVNSFILMAIFMMENGSTIKLMDMVSTIILMVLCMRDTGEMIFNMVKEKNHGLMDQFMKDIIWLERNMEWVFIVGMMEANTQENGMKIKSKDLEHTAGSMVDNIKVSGLITIWTEWVFIPGLMEDVTWVNTKMIKSMDMVFTNGPMEDSILVNG